MRPASRAALAAALVHLTLPLLAGCGGLSFPGGRAASATVWGFTAPWDPRSARSASRNGPALDAVVTGWISLDTLGGAPRALYADTVPVGTTRRMALVTSFDGGRWHPALVRALGLDTMRLAETAASVAELASRAGYRGLVLDFEE